MTETKILTPVARRRAMSGRVRSLAHLVPVDQARNDRLMSVALCGFKAKRSWSAQEAPAWEETCSRCEAAREREAAS